MISAMPRIEITDPARGDLDDIWDYIADDSETAADSLLSGIDHTFQLISENPELGPLRPELSEGIRNFAVKSFVVFDRAIADGMRVIRVLHGSRDIEAVFEEEESD